MWQNSLLYVYVYIYVDVRQMANMLSAPPTRNSSFLFVGGPSSVVWREARRSNPPRPVQQPQCGNNDFRCKSFQKHHVRMKLQLLQMCIFVCFSFSLSSHLHLSSHLYLSFLICLSLFMSVSLSLFSMHCMLCVVVVCVLCVLCVVCVVCWAVRVVVGLCVLWWWWLWMWLCVHFFLSGTEKRSHVYVQNTSVCTFKILPRVRSKRSRVYFENAVSPSLFCSRVSLLSYVSLFLSRYLCSSFSVSCRLSLFLFSITMTMIARPVGSLCTHGPFLP